MRPEVLNLTNSVEASTALTQFNKNRSSSDLLRDRMFRGAVLFELVTAREAVARLPEDLRQRHPDVDRASVVGFHDRTVHGCLPRDYPTVWVAATQEATALAHDIADILDRVYSIEITSRPENG